MPIKYTNASLDPELVKSLQRIHKKNLAPLGIVYSHPAVIRHLVKFHDMSSNIQAELVRESLQNFSTERDHE